MDFDLSTGDDVRNAELRSGLRGYHKEDVDDFRDAVATLVDELRRRADVASGHLAQLGLDEPLDLKEEFATVGREISAILEAARTAATDIRRRATADGERWREEAEADAARMRTEAWEESSVQLESSVAEAQQTRAAANEDVLFIRAQAEKEAIRLTSEAKRDADDVVRTARAEADAIIADARDAVEAAQQRTRALEQRREELMVELEEARRAIGIVQTEIEDRQQRLVAPETQTVRILGQEIAEPEAAAAERGWLDEDATVRLVPREDQRGPEPLAGLEPVVDADDIVAEVESLQDRPRHDDPWGRRPERTVVAPEPEPEPATVEPPAVAPEPEIVETDEREVVAVAETAQVAEAEEAAEAGTTTTAPSGNHVTDEPTPIADDDSGSPEEDDDAISGLFASLRTPASPEANGAAVAPPSQPVADDTTTDAEAELASPISEQAPHVAEAETSDEEAFAAQEAALLPITNRALRAVKMQILEFQNVMLEATKADPDGWRPDPEEYRLALDPHAQALADEAHQAGGGEGTPDLEVEFAAALVAAVNRAADTMMGSGYRETSASLGRVYRSWRSDEAERRLMDLAAAVYERATATRTAS